MDVHVYNYVRVCWCSRPTKIVPHMMSQKNPSRMKNQQSRWLYPFPWYEQDRTRVSGVPVPVPWVFKQGRTRYSGILPRVYRTYQSVGYGFGCRTSTEVIKRSGTYICRSNLAKGSGTGIDVLPSLPNGSDMVRLLVPVSVPDPGILPGPYPVPGHFPAGAPNLSSVEYGYGCRTELTKVSGTGMYVVPNLPKCRARVWKSYQAQ